MTKEVLEFGTRILNSDQISEARTVLDKVVKDGPQVVFFNAHKDFPSHLRIPVIIASGFGNTVSLHLRHIEAGKLNDTKLLLSVGVDEERIPSRTLFEKEVGTNALEMDLGGMSRSLRIVNENLEAFADIRVNISPESTRCVARTLNEADIPESLLKIANEAILGESEWKSLPLGV